MDNANLIILQLSDWFTNHNPVANQPMSLLVAHLHGNQLLIMAHQDFDLLIVITKVLH